MSTSSLSGDARFRHSALGFGRIVALRRNGREVLFCCDDTNLKYWVQRSSLDEIPQGPKGPASSDPAASDEDLKPEPQPFPKVDPQSRSHPASTTRAGSEHRVSGNVTVGRPALEALRLGVVPAQGIEHFTVGLKAEQSRIREDIQRAGVTGAVRFFVAPYGWGKSHTLELAQQFALRAGFAVSAVEIDPLEVSFRRPKRFYRALARNLRMPGTESFGSEALVRRIASARSAEIPSVAARLRILGPALLNYAHFEDGSLTRSLILSYIAGDEAPASVLNRLALRDRRLGSFASIPNYSTVGSIEAAVKLIGDLARLALEGGATGLAILIDEGEHYRELSADLRERADTLLGMLVAEVRTGGIPRCALSMAMTPIPGEEAPSWIDPAAIQELQIPTLSDFEQFLRLFDELYCRTYPDTTPRPGAQDLEQLARNLYHADGGPTSARMLTKAVVFAWDAIRLCGQSWRDLISEGPA